MPPHKMRKVPLSQLTEPKNGLYDVMIDRWWPVSEDGELYFYGTNRFPYASPQCNSNKVIAEKLGRSMAETEHEHCRYEGFKEIRQIPLVYRPVDIAEYV